MPAYKMEPFGGALDFLLPGSLSLSKTNLFLTWSCLLEAKADSFWVDVTSGGGGAT